jgi:hypothetical protein
MDQDHNDDEDVESESGEVRENHKRKGRKPLSKEEALERRRESNRRCAKRGRARKKQEDEEIRIEFEKLRQSRGFSQETGEEGGEDRVSTSVLSTVLRPKKRGRPVGSKGGMDKTATAAASTEEVADLKADNRMLRAEMQRLIEENAQLRARMLRLEDVERRYSGIQ